MTTQAKTSTSHVSERTSTIDDPVAVDPVKSLRHVDAVRNGLFVDILNADFEIHAELESDILICRSLDSDGPCPIWCRWSASQNLLDAEDFWDEVRSATAVSIGAGDFPRIAKYLREHGFACDFPRPQSPREVNLPDHYGIREALQSGESGVIEVAHEDDVMSVLSTMLSDQKQGLEHPRVSALAETSIIICDSAKTCRQVSEACKLIDAGVLNLVDGVLDACALEFDPADPEKTNHAMTLLTDFHALDALLHGRICDDEHDEVMNVFCDARNVVIIGDNGLDDLRHHELLAAIGPSVRKLLLTVREPGETDETDEFGRYTKLGNRLFGRTLLSIPKLVGPCDPPPVEFLNSKTFRVSDKYSESVGRIRPWHTVALNGAAIQKASTSESNGVDFVQQAIATGSDAQTIALIEMILSLDEEDQLKLGQVVGVVSESVQQVVRNRPVAEYLNAREQGTRPLYQYDDCCIGLLSDLPLFRRREQFIRADCSIDPISLATEQGTSRHGVQTKIIDLLPTAGCDFVELCDERKQAYEEAGHRVS